MWVLRFPRINTENHDDWHHLIKGVCKFTNCNHAYKLKKNHARCGIFFYFVLFLFGSFISWTWFASVKRSNMQHAIREYRYFAPQIKKPKKQNRFNIDAVYRLLLLSLLRNFVACLCLSFLFLILITFLFRLSYTRLSMWCFSVVYLY